MSTSCDNQSKFQSVKFNGLVNLQFRKGSYEGFRVRNLSLGGIFVEGKLQQHQMEDCLIRLFHKEPTGNNSIKATGKIVRSTEEGVELQFTSMTFENYTLLQTTLIKNAPQPAAILREIPKASPFQVTYM